MIYSLAQNILENTDEYMIFFTLFITLVSIFLFMIYWSFLLIEVSRKDSLNRYNKHQTILVRST